jgi:hypothetical protein
MDAEFQQQVISDLTELKTHMKSLVGNGQPGRIALIEQAVERHERYSQRTRGYIAGVLGVLTLLGSVTGWVLHNMSAAVVALQTFRH